MSIFIKDLARQVGETVEIKGWLYNKRSSGPIAFLELRDGSGWVQAVAVKDKVSAEVWSRVEAVSQESSVVVTGVVSKHPKKENVFEVQLTNLAVVQLAHDYPISKKEHGPDFLMENRHLWLRSKNQWAILRVRDAVITAINEFLHGEQFIKVDSPIFTPNACEGTSTLFA